MLDIILVARLGLDPSREKDWRALALDNAEMEWTDAPLFSGQPAQQPTVGALLDAMDADFVASNSVSFFQRDEGIVTGFLKVDDTQRFHQDLATALRLAGHVGGAGEARFFMPSEKVALVVTIGKDTDDKTPEWQPANESFKDEELALHFVDVFNWTKAKLENPSLVRSAYAAAQKTFEVGPMNETHESLLGELAAVDAESLYAAIAGKMTPLSKPLASVWPDVAALQDALSKADPLIRVVGIELLATVDPKKAETLAAKLADDPSSFVRRSVVTALGQIPTKRAFEQLLRSAADPERSQWTIAAIAANQSPGADKALLATLDLPDPFGAALWTDLAPRTPARAAAAARATTLLHAIGKRKSKGAVPVLFSLWSDHPAREVRKEAARALAFIGGKKVEAKQQDLMFTLMEMGKSLNQDDVRRRELLGVTERDDGGIQKFSELDAPRLTTLWEEGFINLQGTQNDSPSAAQFLGMMREHPEIRAHGYVVSKKRGDYRVSLEGIAADLKGADLERTTALRELFTGLSESATNSELEGDELYLWWTLRSARGGDDRWRRIRLPSSVCELSLSLLWAAWLSRSLRS